MNEEEMPYFNFAQLKLIVMGLENLDISKLDDGYREVHKHLLSRMREENKLTLTEEIYK